MSESTILMILLMAVPLLLAMGAQWKVKSAFAKYSRIRSSSGLTGADAASIMLRQAGIQGVAIQRVEGTLSDHYDPSARVVRLSREVHDGASIAAIAVACHEVGHAIQHARKYAPLTLRSIAVPVATFGSGFGQLFLFLGAMAVMANLAVGTPLVFIGLAGLVAVLAFQVITLPVEFDASARAREMMTELGFVRSGPESNGAAAVLNAAALTYVAAVVSTLATILYYVLMILNARHQEN